MGTFGDARGTVGASRAEFARFVVLDAGVLVPCDDCPFRGTSTSDDSGVVGRDVAALNVGRSKDVRDGEGGSGVGGLL